MLPNQIPNRAEILPTRTLVSELVIVSASMNRNVSDPSSLAAAVAKFDNLQFLSDTVPKTMTYKQYKERKATDEAARVTNGTDSATNGITSNGDEVVNRQRSIAHMIQGSNSANGVANGVPDTPPRRNHSMANSPIVDRTVQPERNGHPHIIQNDGDVEMQG